MPIVITVRAEFAGETSADHHKTIEYMDDLQTALRRRDVILTMPDCVSVSVTSVETIVVIDQGDCSEEQLDDSEHES